MSPYKRFEYLEMNDRQETAVRKLSPSDTIETTMLAGAKGRALVADQVIGGYGSAVGQFNCPCGLAVDNQSNLYVADSYNHRIQKITPTGKAMSLGSKGSVPGKFLNPQDIAVTTDRALYVLEQGNCRIQKIARDGRLELVIGGKGSQSGCFISPMGLAVDSVGYMYIADTGNGRLQKLSPSGLPIYTVSSNRDRKLYGPQGIEVDVDGNCYIADTFSHCVVKFNRYGREIARFGCRGKTSGQFDEPQDLVLDSNGLLYVIEMANNRMQVFDTKHEYVTCFDGILDPVGGLKSPTGIAVGPLGDIYIADTMNHRVLHMVWR